MRHCRLLAVVAGLILVPVGGCYRYMNIERPLECPPAPPHGYFLLHDSAGVPPYTIRGRVVQVGLPDGERPIASVLVAVPELERRVQTDTTGQFALDSILPGRHLVVTRRIGFASRSDSITLAPATGVRLQIGLRPQAVDEGCEHIVLLERRRVWRWPWQ